MLLAVPRADLCPVHSTLSAGKYRCRYCQTGEDSYDQLFFKAFARFADAIPGVLRDVRTLLGTRHIQPEAHAITHWRRVLILAVIFRTDFGEGRKYNDSIQNGYFPNSPKSGEAAQATLGSDIFSASTADARVA
jgi:hypothetical protein